MITPLTSLRFIFALMVFGAHCYVIDSFFDAHFFKEGFVGVSFFFVLSGFIISYNYQRKLQEKQTSWRTFWVARIARVYPLHWLTLFVAAADQCVHPASGLLFLVQQPLVEFVLRTAVLFLFSFPRSFSTKLQTVAGGVGCFGGVAPDGDVFHAGRGHQRVLVCQSRHPSARLFGGNAVIPML